MVKNKANKVIRSEKEVSGYLGRQKIYMEIEEKRGHPLLVYATSIRGGVSAMIASDAVREFEDQLLLVPKDIKKLDIAISSHGGDGLTAWRIISVVREYLGKDSKIVVLVPHHAFSAATLMALGADEIYMHPFACLGPIDPQITVTSKDGLQQKFAYQDVVAFAEFLRDEGRLTEQPQVSEMLKFLMNEIKPSVLGASKRSSSQSTVMAQKLLSTHMKEAAEVQKAEVIAEALNKSFFSHGHAVSRSEAEQLGLKVCPDDPWLNERLWMIHLSLEDDLKERQPFNPLMECLQTKGNGFLTESPVHIEIPANAPDHVQNQIWHGYVQQMKTHQAPTVDFELKNAVLESRRRSSQHISRGRIMVARAPNLDFMISAPVLSAKWEVEP